MANLFKPHYSKNDPETGEHVTRRAKKWYGQYTDAKGVTRRVALSTDKTAAGAMLTELVRKVELQRSGLLEASADHLGQSMAAQLSEYKAHLGAKGRSEFHISETGRLITKIADACRIEVLRDLQSSGEHIEKYLADRLESGSSHRTVNGDLTAIRSFCRWLMRKKRLLNDPTIGISKLNEAEDRRRERRALTEQESQLLVATARASKRVIRGLSGEDRAVLYTVAQRTGLRRSELLSLTPSSFDLGGNPPVVRLAAKNSKHRKTDVLPLSADVTETLVRYLAGRPVNEPLWPGPWWQHSAEMLYADLKAAGIQPVSDDGRVADFHGQRVTFITELARAGNSAATVQKLARHSDYNLTLRTYTRLQVEDLAQAVDRLPALGESAKENPEATSASPASLEIVDDARLRDLVQVWPALPEHIKNAIFLLAVPPKGQEAK